MTEGAAGVRLCALDDIPDPGARGFVIGTGPARVDLFVVRWADALHAYVNQCPHRGWPLETFPDRFLTADGRLILCSGHGARFRIVDGLCLAGPCKGLRLRKMEVQIVDGAVMVR